MLTRRINLPTGQSQLPEGQIQLQKPVCTDSKNIVHLLTSLLGLHFASYIEHVLSHTVEIFFNYSSNSDRVAS